jgi:hypothetical protein
MFGNCEPFEVKKTTFTFVFWFFPRERDLTTVVSPKGKPSFPLHRGPFNSCGVYFLLFYHHPKTFFFVFLQFFLQFFCHFGFFYVSILSPPLLLLLFFF